MEERQFGKSILAHHKMGHLLWFAQKSPVMAMGTYSSILTNLPEEAYEAGFAYIAK